MATRVVEWKKPYTWWEAITVDEDKVISLNLRDENNLIIYDEWDDEIYVDLQLPNEIEPTDAFPIGVNTGRVIVDNGWDKTGTIISAKTTSGDEIKLLYADDWTLWIDNGTWTFKQIYFKSDVDGIITTLTTYINTELAKKQNGVSSDTAPSNPSEWDLWYDTVNDSLKVYDGTNWVATGGWWSWDVVVSTDTGNELSTGVGLWLWTETDFSSISTPDTNTLYIQYKSDWGGWSMDDSFAWTSLDTALWTATNYGWATASYTVNNGLSMSKTWGRWGYAIYTNKTFEGTENEIIIECTVTAEWWTYKESMYNVFWINNYTDNNYVFYTPNNYPFWVALNSTYDYSFRAYVKDGATSMQQYTDSPLVNPTYTLKFVINVTNRTCTCYVDNVQKYSYSLYGTKNDAIWQPIFSIACISHTDVSCSISNVKIDIT